MSGFVTFFKYPDVAHMYHGHSGNGANCWKCKYKSVFRLNRYLETVA